MLRDVVFNVLHTHNRRHTVLKDLSKLPYDAPASAIVRALRGVPGSYAAKLALECLAVPDHLFRAWKRAPVRSLEEFRALRDVEDYFLACERRERGE